MARMIGFFIGKINKSPLNTQDYVQNAKLRHKNALSCHKFKPDKDWTMHMGAKHVLCYPVNRIC